MSEGPFSRCVGDRANRRIPSPAVWEAGRIGGSPLPLCGRPGEAEGPFSRCAGDRAKRRVPSPAVRETGRSGGSLLPLCGRPGESEGPFSRPAGEGQDEGGANRSSDRLHPHPRPSPAGRERRDSGGLWPKNRKDKIRVHAQGTENPPETDVPHRRPAATQPGRGAGARNRSPQRTGARRTRAADPRPAHQASAGRSKRLIRSVRPGLEF
jgi:hypothetical protein